MSSDIRINIFANDSNVGRTFAKLSEATKDWDRKLGDLSRALTEVGARSVSPEVKLATAEAVAKLDAFKEDLRSVNGKTATAKINVDDKGVRDATQGMSGLMAAAVALAPAAVPVLAAVTGGIVAVGSAATAGAAGLGAFAAVAKTDLGQVKDASDKITQAQQRVTLAISSTQRKTALAQEAALWKSLSPAEAGAVRELQNFQDTWKGFAATFDPQVFGLMAGGLRIAEAGLSNLAPLVLGASGALKTLEDHARAALESPYWQHFFAFLGQQAGPAITALGTTLGNLAHGFAGLLEAFAPVARQVEAGMVHLSARFAEFGTSASKGGLQQFVDYVQREGPQLVSTIGQIGSALVHISAAVAPLGGVELQVIKALAEGLDKLATTAPGLLEVAAAVYSVTKVRDLLAPLGAKFLAVGGAATTMATEGVASMDALAGATAADAAKSEAALAGWQASIAAKLGLIGSVASKLAVPVAAAVAITQYASDQGGKQLQQEAEELATNAVKMQQAKAELDRLKAEMAKPSNQGANVAVGNIAQAYQLAGAYGEDTKRVKELTTEIAMAHQIMAANGQQMGRTAISAEQVASANVALTKTFQSIFAGMVQAGKGSQQLSAKAYAVQEALQNATDAASGFNAVLAILLGDQMSTAAAADQFHKDLNDLSSALVKNNHTLKGNSDAAIQNRDAIRQLVTDAENHATAVEKQTGSIARGRAALLEDLGAIKKHAEATVGDKTAVDQFLRSNGMLPGQVSAAWTKSADAASSKSKDIQGSLHGIQYTAEQAAGAVDGITRALARLPNHKTVTITVDQTGTASVAGYKMQAHAAGGPITGPGTATSDSVPFWGSNGEYVVKAASVAKYGLHMMDAINAGRFASGGLINALTTHSLSPAVSMAPPAARGGDLNVTVPVHIDGRKVAEATVRFTRDELVRMARRGGALGIA